jgi:hypothetical protein
MFVQIVELSYVKEVFNLKEFIATFFICLIVCGVITFFLGAIIINARPEKDWYAA